MFKIAMRTQFAMLIGLFALVLGVRFLLLFATNHSESIRELERRLEQVAESADIAMNGAAMHANLQSNSIDLQGDKVNAAKLQGLASANDAIYIYSVVFDTNTIRFISSNPTPEELQNQTYTQAFWQDYSEAPSQLKQALTNETSRFGSYTDRWGQFKSIFVPKRANDGRTYAWGVDVRMQQISALARNSLLKAVRETLMFFALSLPFVVISLRISYGTWKAREQKFYRDELTQLGSKHALLEDIEECAKPSLALINIDRFRQFNTLHGIAEGDAFLRAFAYNLSTYQHPLLKTHTAYRIHADEFAVLADMELPYDKREQIFIDFFKTILRQKYRTSDSDMNSITAKFGIAVGPHKDIFTHAEIALTKARENNESIVIFNREPDLTAHYKTNRMNSEKVREALETGRIVPYFHPIVSSQDGKIEKYEALARLVDTQGNVQMMPDEFVPILKRDRLYHRFTRHMFEKTLTVSQKEDVDISLNISTQDILYDSEFNKLVNLTQSSGRAKHVHIELLECDALVDLGRTVEAIKAFQKIGCRVGLDDLGKGYSNFDRLTTLPIDFVKLDRSVMPNISNSIEVMKIAEDIIEFAKKKNITTVAEFCSDRYLCSAARHMGIDFVQGFYLAEPSADIVREVSKFIATDDYLVS